MNYIRLLNALGNADVALVGGKNASLGEMVSRLGEHGVRVPNGFATTAQAYFDFLSTNNLIRAYSHRCLIIAPSPTAPAVVSITCTYDCPSAYSKMVRSDLGASGVMLAFDTETGIRDVVFISALFGLGENVVYGVINPDEFCVFKPELAAGKRPTIRTAWRR